jgi:hypothetical protein
VARFFQGAFHALGIMLIPVDTKHIYPASHAPPPNHGITGAPIAGAAGRRTKPGRQRTDTETSFAVWKNRSGRDMDNRLARAFGTQPAVSHEIDAPNRPGTDRAPFIAKKSLFSRPAGNYPPQLKLGLKQIGYLKQRGQEAGAEVFVSRILFPIKILAAFIPICNRITMNLYPLAQPRPALP